MTYLAEDVIDENSHLKNQLIRQRKQVKSIFLVKIEYEELMVAELVGLGKEIGAGEKAYAF